jgi:succinyl-CoA synthetase beta subunit
LVAKGFGDKGKHEYVVKAQVLGGGRGLGYFKETGFKGGVHLVKSPEEVKHIAEQMCGKTLITKQSGDAGFPCNCVYIVEKINIDKEFYLSITLDRKAGSPVFIYSPAGGMAIEDVAHTNPEKIFKIKIDPLKGLEIDDLLKAAKNLGCEH